MIALGLIATAAAGLLVLLLLAILVQETAAAAVRRHEERELRALGVLADLDQVRGRPARRRWKQRR